MKRNKFEKIWDNFILVKVNSLERQCENIHFDKFKKELIWQEYQLWNMNIHTYMKGLLDRIDRHKVSALLMIAILKLQPFTIIIPSDKKILLANLISNEILAFHTGISILLDFIISDAKKNSDTTTLQLFEDNRFVFPQCSDGLYEDHVYRNLFYSKTNGVYDPFALSNMFFMIESFTRECKSNSSDFSS